MKGAQRGALNAIGSHRTDVLRVEELEIWGGLMTQNLIVVQRTGFGEH